ncbi:MAG: hemerythrin domain-containing protein [Sporocytophaga sp.]|uniref:hemerythrin domain-containing protein n=1 Tax=Sporocytophaga sp. TaxID=2231183 RepID=UPI001B17A097|nr:hemerythrin domain-containing protein [Sporocytophaga sp.]MBO9701409.1 hemerythrin domain-containing protein [Sporocytophaga sp.]
MSNKIFECGQILDHLKTEHHFIFESCYRIRSGLLQRVPTKRIKIYTDLFYHEYLKPHFELEEKFIFAVFEKDNLMVKRAVAEHRKLKRLFGKNDSLEESLSLIEEILENHLRFEEHVLFASLIEKIENKKILFVMPELAEVSIEWPDKFWIN